MSSLFAKISLCLVELLSAIQIFPMFEAAATCTSTQGSVSNFAIELQILSPEPFVAQVPSTTRHVTSMTALQ